MVYSLFLEPMASGSRDTVYIQIYTDVDDL